MAPVRSIVALIFLLFCAGCAGQGNTLPLHREMAPLPRGPICRVAVLPFLNDSKFPQGNLILQKIFMSEFREAGDYQILQEGDILKTYQQLRLFPGRAPSLEQMKIVADRINAQVLITGIVMEMREDPGPYSTVIPKIVLELQVRDGRNGETLWTVYHRRLGSEYTKTMHFGTIHTIAGLGRQMASEIINLWFEKGLPVCNVFSQP
ncbi:MAG: hypothetical protein QNK24_12420 [Desulfuromusa sp.]|nr:hypothetical protein [Desulfuromusa sp.]